MDVLIETHDYNELKFWIKTKNILLGINNRNLKNMKVNIVQFPESEDPDSFARNKESKEIINYLDEYIILDNHFIPYIKWYLIYSNFTSNWNCIF